MTTRLTVASISGCVLSEGGDRVILSIGNRRGQEVDLIFTADDFAGLMPVFLATAAQAAQHGREGDEAPADHQLRQRAAPATQLASRKLDDDVEALGFRLEGSTAELWLACAPGPSAGKGAARKPAARKAAKLEATAHGEAGR